MSGTENALLTIPNSEEKSGSPNHPITSRDLPNLSRAVYHLGGVPPGQCCVTFINYIPEK